MDVTKPVHTPEQCIDKIKKALDVSRKVKGIQQHELDDLNELIREAEQSLDDLERHLTRDNLEKACTAILT